MQGYSNDNDQRITDAELRTLPLKIKGDPEQQPRFTETPAEGAELVRVLNIYASPFYPRRKVWCHKCDAHRHGKGFSAELSSGEVTTFGSTCGAEVFGERWEEAQQRLEGLLERQELLLALDALLPKVPGLLRWLGRLRRDFEVFESVKARLSSAPFSSLYRALQRAHEREGGRLTAYESFRDRAAEERSNSERKLYRHENRVVHVIAGGAILNAVTGTHSVTLTRNLLKNVTEIATKTDIVPTSRMKALREMRKEAVRQLRDAIEAHRAARAFFLPSNLAGVADWATRTTHLQGTYEARQGALIRTDVPALVRLPADYPTIDDTPLVLLTLSAPDQEAA